MKQNEEYHPDETEVKYIHEILAMIAAYGGDRNMLDSFLRVKGKRKVIRMSDMMKNTLQKSKDEGIAEGLAKGLAEGRAEGKAEGKAEGRAEGKAEGKVQGILESVKNLMDSYKLTAQAAMDVLKVSAADRPAILAAL